VVINADPNRHMGTSFSLSTDLGDSNVGVDPCNKFIRCGRKHLKNNLHLCGYGISVW